VKPAPIQILRQVMACLVAGLVLASARPAHAQLSATEEERLQILTEPDAIKKKLEKERNKVPYEFFKSQVAPFDVLPFVKPHHWSTLTLEMRTNEDDYDGFLQTDAVKLPEMPLQIVYRRDARMMKEQRRGLAQQVLLTRIPKEWTLDLVRPGSLRPDASWSASLTTLEPHQMLILILSKDATNQFASWNRMMAMIPMGVERDSTRDLDRQRYYRLVLPMEPDKPPLSSHPLTWTTISHIVWDGLPPDVLSVSQQQAILDWLHWGGQLIFTGGAGQSYAIYHDSFLGPYLPADASGQTVGLTQEDLKPLSQSYPPPTAPDLPAGDGTNPVPPIVQGFGSIYRAPVPIAVARDKPVYLSVLRPVAGASTIPLGEASPHLLAVESRVGRGRITMLTINPLEPGLAAWPGLDTLVRRVVLRRPEESVLGVAGSDGLTYRGPQRGRMGGADLTWYRITSRDARPLDDAAGRLPKPPKIKERPTPTELARLGGPIPAKSSSPVSAPPSSLEDETDPENPIPASGVADWRDTARFPTLSRDLLEEASGITIPSKLFVLKVILAYLIAVVPLNWLICRFALNRREWAWVIVPIVALGFAIAVQRVAAYDMGFDSACDEIDLLEVHGDYPRGHLSRFASLYTTGRGNYSITYPNNNTALALPLSSGPEMRGEDVTTSTWQSAPVPGLLGLSVQPRSMSMFRAEEIATLAGAIRIEGDGASRRLINGSELELRDATLIDMSTNGPPKEPVGTAERKAVGLRGDQSMATGDPQKERYLGTIAAGATVELGATPAAPLPDRVEFEAGPNPNSIFLALRTTWERRDENFGEIRLVAWVPHVMPGQVIDPPVDRQRGFTAVIVHLRSGPPPNPGGPHFNILAVGPETAPAAVDPRRAMEIGTPTIFSGRARPLPRSKSARRPPPGNTEPAAQP
jgi:hypothetical protein